MDVNATLSEIMEHLFHVNGDYDRALELIEALAEWIDGEGFHPTIETEVSWHDVIIGAYWYCNHYHNGQASEEYRLLCVTGKVYSPGMATQVEQGSAEEMVYDSLIELSGNGGE